MSFQLKYLNFPVDELQNDIWMRNISEHIPFLHVQNRVSAKFHISSLQFDLIKIKAREKIPPSLQFEHSLARSLDERERESVGEMKGRRFFCWDLNKSSAPPFLAVQNACPVAPNTTFYRNSILFSRIFSDPTGKNVLYVVPGLFSFLIIVFDIQGPLIFIIPNQHVYEKQELVRRKKSEPPNYRHFSRILLRWSSSSDEQRLIRTWVHFLFVFLFLE